MRSQSIDELIVGHMNDLKSLIEKDIAWMKDEPELLNYAIHCSHLEELLWLHAEQIHRFRRKVVEILATKMGKDGREIYGPELSNIRTREWFANLASYFTKSVK